MLSLAAARTRLPQLASSRRLLSTALPTPRSAVVTGAGQGIGRAISLRLAKDGFNVCLLDLESNEANVESLAIEIRSLGQDATVAIGDVSKRADVESAVQKSVKELGELSVMVANAGIARVSPLLESTEEDFRLQLDANLIGVFNSDVVAARQFIDQGTIGGKLINAASLASFKPTYMLAPYSTTKAGVRSLTTAFAMELAPHKITCNGYAPGIVDSPMWKLIDAGMSKYNGAAPGENFSRTVSGIAAGRTSVPEDVSNVVSFLAGPDSNYVNGSIICVDGGMFYHI